MVGEAGRARVSPAVLVGVSAWRLVIVGCALYGFSDATGWTDDVEALSQLASLFAALGYLGLLLYPLTTGGTRHEPRSPWLRGAIAVLLLLVASVFFTVMDGDVGYLPFEHVVTPALVLADWLFVGRDQASTRWWFPLTWVLPPLAYLVYFLASDVHEYLYPFLDPADEGFPRMLGGLFCLVLLLGYVLHGTGKLRANRSSAARQHPPVTQRVH